MNDSKLVRKFRLEHWQVVNIGLVLYDALVVNLAYFAAIWLRFDCQYSAIPRQYVYWILRFAPLYTPVCLLIFWRCRLYNSLWRFASYTELLYTILATSLTFLVQILGVRLLFGNMPLAYYCVGVLLQFLAVLAVRFSYRLVLLLRDARRKKGDVHRVMLIGAGAAGQMLLRDLQRNQDSGDEVVCIMDDDPNKWDRFVEGVPVVGGRDAIPAQVKQRNIDRIYLAIPSATAQQKREILNICNETGCELKQVPGVIQMLHEDVTLQSMKDVSVEDLLGREPVKVDLNEVFSFLQGKTILVTGGGGSIGSELCRQIAGHSPKRLIIFDIYENNAYSIQMELQEKYPNLDLVTLIGSVRDSRRLEQVFSQYRPEVVYHAAAHKHVPLMEDSPWEAIKNNTLGTYKTAYAAMRHGCQRFVLISTDKAVNPTSVMGASKRLCEMIIQTFDRKIKDGQAQSLPSLYTHAETESCPERLPEDIHTEFVAVRFGNVLGSNGSVVPLFKRQIAQGGPVTVTHPDVIRYFMTIPEAVSLVLQAGVYARGGEIFVLDMGEPVKIDTLARNLIRLSGYKPDVDIPVVYTGLLPGEKLYEERLMAEEGMRKTPNALINIGNPIPMDANRFLEQLPKLMASVYENREDVREQISHLVPTYQPDMAGAKPQADAPEAGPAPSPDPRNESGPEEGSPPEAEAEKRELAGAGV